MSPTEVEHEQRLDEVIAAYLRACREGTAPDRRRLLDSFPDLADDLREFFADHDRVHALATPIRDLAPSLARSGPPLLPTGEPFGPYEILGEIARGGMGVVFKARHCGLGRVVALKLLLAGPLASSTDRQRFHTEAEAAASLDHPNIVPIYEVGEQDDRPFISMKYMEGGSLAQHLRLGSRPRSPAEAARLVSSVAWAIDHAHRRGVLHRDLKPANILLDGQGQAHVSDFGLARRQGGETGPTQTGAIVGTPGYMAPEQARGGRDVTTATDVYGLGAILYELLTGQPPFRGSDPLDVLRQVLDCEPTRPRLVRPVPRDLETICLKCLQKDPRKRYASAANLAADLERFLSGQPIEARPIGSLERACRWLARSPLTAGLVAALVLSVTAGFGLVLYQWQRAERSALEARIQRDRAELARADALFHQQQAEEKAREARLQRDQADDSFREAHHVVNDFCLNVSQELAALPTLQPLRKSLLENALRYYRGFLERRGHDPNLKRELAETHSSVAHIIAAIGARAEALAAHQQALDLYRELLDAAPNDVGLQKSLASSLINIAILQDTRTALETSARTVALYERFLRDTPGDPQLRSGLALTLGNRASQLLRAGRLDEGEECLRRARESQEQLIQENPKVDVLRSELASTLNNAGVLASRKNHKPLALCYHLRVEALRRQLAEGRPRDPVRQADLAAARHHLGLALAAVGLKPSAIEAFQFALDTRRKLATEHPLVTRYQVDLSLSLNHLGLNHSREGRPEKALACHHQALELQEKLVRLDPGTPGLKALAAETHFNISAVLGAQNRREEEAASLRQARQIQEELVQIEPERLEYGLDLARTLNNLGINLWVRKQGDEARGVLRQAIASTRPLFEQTPGLLAPQRALNAHYGALAEIEWRMGNGTASAELIRQRIELWPANPNELYRGGSELARAASVMNDNERERCLAEALDTLRRAIAAGFRDLGRLRADADLALLRPRADFQALVEQLSRSPGVLPNVDERER
jgi:serine/threonine-protein kinase